MLTIKQEAAIGMNQLANDDEACNLRPGAKRRKPTSPSGDNLVAATIVRLLTIVFAHVIVGARQVQN